MTDDDVTSQDQQLTDFDLDAQRATIEQSLDEIATELNTALVHEGLAYPVYLCIPSGGHAVATIACPLDPKDHEWERISEIARDIVSKRIGGTRLCSRGLPCAMAGTAMGAADLTVG